MNSNFWRRTAFFLIIAGCSAFVLLTLIAMLFYPGGTFTDPNSRGYSFFGNFFSELGMLRTHAGAPKPVSLVLFILAMFLASASLGLFFLALPRHFGCTPLARFFGGIGSILGMGSALCFIGVALFPADGNMTIHIQAVTWAFRLFPAAVLCYTIVMFHDKGFSYGWAWGLVAFLLLLVGYLILLETGPDIHSDLGRIIQAVGQKIIVYASILTAILQSWGVLKQPGGFAGG
jgi:hypothetical protein